jgi:hypothetical protein
MSTYRVDPLHPDRLVCEICGDTVAPVPPDLATFLPATEGFTRQQLGLAGFAGLQQAHSLGDALAEHDVACRWRRNPGGTVYVHVLPRNDEDGQ